MQAILALLTYKLWAVLILNTWCNGITISLCTMEHIPYFNVMAAPSGLGRKGSFKKGYQLYKHVTLMCISRHMK